MGIYTAKDGVDIFFEDWGSGQPVVFSHGWPLTSDYPGAPHGLTGAHEQEFDKDLLDFLES